MLGQHDQNLQLAQTAAGDQQKPISQLRRAVAAGQDESRNAPIFARHDGFHPSQRRIVFFSLTCN
jgi:hypothetical protein